MNGKLLHSNFAPEALYANFEQFLEVHAGMTVGYGLSYVWVYSLMRLARHDLEKGRRVFDWAVKRVCLNMLADEQFPPPASAFSPQAQQWAQRAVDVFGRNPLRSLALVEGLYLLERLAVWAEAELENRGFGRSLVEFRKRPQSNAEIAGKIAWLDLFYQQARARAITDTEHYIRRRDCAIALSITALADGVAPSDSEIADAMNHDMPTHKSLAQLADSQRSPIIRGSLVRQDEVVSWVLGPYQKELAF